MTGAVFFVHLNLSAFESFDLTLLADYHNSVIDLE